MKPTKFALTLLTAFVSSGALAGPYYHGHRHHHHRAPHVVHHHGHWVAPLIIGGVIGAAIAANRVEAQTAAPVVVVPQTVQSNATVTYNDQGQQVIMCPQGLYPFEVRGYVRNGFNQYVETTYIKCQ